MDVVRLGEQRTTNQQHSRVTVYFFFFFPAPLTSERPASRLALRYGSSSSITSNSNIKPVRCGCILCEMESLRAEVELDGVAGRVELLDLLMLLPLDEVEDDLTEALRRVLMLGRADATSLSHVRELVEVEDGVTCE